MKFDTEYYEKLDNLFVLLGKCAPGIDACVAGGAIRDSLLDKPVKDIDIFYACGDINEDELVKHFTIDTTIQELQEELNELYKSSAWKVTYPSLRHPSLDVDIQLIKVHDGNVWGHIHDTFPCNLSKVAYAPSGGVFLTPEFIKDMSFELLTFTSNCPYHYKEKMIKKYPEYLVEGGNTHNDLDL